MFYETTLINLVHKNLDFLGFKLVLKAISPESYPRLDVIKIQEDLIVGTDGHRLHIYYTKEKHPPGTFKPLIKQKNKIVLEKVESPKFPDWKNVLPTEKEIEKRITITNIDSRGYTKLIRQLDEDRTLEFNYFKDLDRDMTTVFITKEGRYGKTRGILFQNSDSTKKALIMPIRIYF